MKTLRSARLLFNASIVLIFCFAGIASTAAQEMTYYQNTNDSGKGYWKLFTNSVNQCTTIKFFDQNNELIYEEIMPGKYVKLTDRNIAQINQTFDQVFKNRLVAGRIKTTVLPLDRQPLAEKKEWTTTGLEAEKRTKEEMSNLGIRVNFLSLENTSKFRLLFENPTRRRLDVQLENEANRVVFAETVNNPRYMRSFDLQSLPTGTYTLRVMTLDRKYKYTKQIELGSSTQRRQIQLVPFAPSLITSNRSN